MVPNGVHAEGKCDSRGYAETDGCFEGVEIKRYSILIVQTDYY